MDDRSNLDEKVAAAKKIVEAAKDAEGDAAAEATGADFEISFEPLLVLPYYSLYA